MKPIKVSGRIFDTKTIDIIRQVIESAQPAQRTHIAREVCRTLNWTNHLGELKAMSCRVALLRLHREGYIELPPPRNGNGNGKPLSKRTMLPTPTELHCSLKELNDLSLVPVTGKESSSLWNGLIDQYHYLGYHPLPGAQLRYLIQSREGLLGAIGWGAAAWKVAPRDHWLGWTAEQREAKLPWVLNNSRYLILPYVRCRNLASKVLAMSEKAVPRDFEKRYGIRPVLFETFVEKRFAASCYRAANWQYLGDTQGRGRDDRARTANLPIKALYVKALVKDVQSSLGIKPVNENNITISGK